MNEYYPNNNQAYEPTYVQQPVQSPAESLAKPAKDKVMLAVFALCAAALVGTFIFRVAQIVLEIFSNGFATFSLIYVQINAVLYDVFFYIAALFLGLCAFFIFKKGSGKTAFASISYISVAMTGIISALSLPLYCVLAPILQKSVKNTLQFFEVADVIGILISLTMAALCVVAAIPMFKGKLIKPIAIVAASLFAFTLVYEYHTYGVETGRWFFYIQNILSYLVIVGKVAFATALILFAVRFKSAPKFNH